MFPQTTHREKDNNKRAQQKVQASTIQCLPARIPQFPDQLGTLGFPLKHLLQWRKLQISSPIPCNVFEGLRQWPSPVYNRWSVCMNSATSGTGLIPPHKAAPTLEVRGVLGGQGWEENMTSCF